jgi:hypothetical protein
LSAFGLLFQLLDKFPPQGGRENDESAHTIFLQ